jgi:hypothetical protein
MKYLYRLALNLDPPDFCLLSTWDYRHEPQAPCNYFFLETSFQGNFMILLLLFFFGSRKELSLCIVHITHLNFSNLRRALIPTVLWGNKFRIRKVKEVVQRPTATKMCSSTPGLAASLPDFVPKILSLQVIYWHCGYSIHHLQPWALRKWLLSLRLNSTTGATPPFLFALVIWEIGSLFLPRLVWTMILFYASCHSEMIGVF